MFPRGNSISDRNDDDETVAVWDDHVQDLLHHNIHQPDHELPVPDGSLGRSVCCRLSSHIITKVQDRDHCKDCQSLCVACLRYKVDKVFKKSFKL